MNKILKNILFLVGKKHLTSFFLFLFCLFILSFIELVSISSVPLLIGTILEPNFISNNIVITNDFFKNFLFNLNNSILIISICVVSIFILKNILIGIFFYSFNSFLKDINLEICTRLFKSYILLPKIKLSDLNSNILIRNLVNEVNLTVEFLRVLVNFLKESLLFLFICLTMFFFSFKYTSLMIAFFSIILLIFFKVFRVYLFKLGKENQLIRGAKIKLISESYGSIIDLKIFAKENYIIKKFRNISHQSLKIELITSFIALLPKLFFESLTIIILVSVTLYVLSLGISNSEAFAILSLITVVSVRLLPVFTTMSSSLSRLKSIQSSIILIKNDIQLNESINNEDPNKEKTHAIFDKEIVLSNLKFKYPASDTTILDIDNLVLKKGKSIGIVGSSGIGKSTFVNLIVGLIDPISGSIMIDNVNINKNIKGWQKLIGYVSQTVFLLDTSLKNNIAFGEEDEDINLPKIEEVIKICNLSNFVNSLPLGLMTNIGEMGNKISGGQKQRIALARALYKDSQIIIFDEATSNLDIGTENEILDNIFDKNFKKDKTYIFISHRDNTLKNCEEIYTIDKSRLIKK